MSKKNAIGNEVVTDLSVLSEAQQEKAKNIKASGGTLEVTKCQWCGKFLVRDTSLEHEAGDRCYDLHVNRGLTTVDLQGQRKTQTLPEVPEGWVKTSVIHKMLEKRGIPVSRMVKAFGGDRGDGPLLDPRWEFHFIGNARYVDGWCASEESFKMLMGSEAPVAKIVPSGKKATQEKAKAQPKSLPDTTVPDLSAI